MSGDSDVSEVELSEEEHSQAGDQFLRTARVPRTSDHTDASYESDEQHSQQLRSISVPAPANSWQVTAAVGMCSGALIRHIAFCCDIRRAT